MLCFWYFSLGRTGEAYECIASLMVGKANLNNKEETRFFFLFHNLSWWGGGGTLNHSCHSWKRPLCDCISSVDTFTDYTQSIKLDHHVQGHWNHSPLLLQRMGSKPAGTRKGQVLIRPFHPEETLRTSSVSHKQIWNVSSRKWIFTELTGTNWTSLPNARHVMQP